MTNLRELSSDLRVPMPDLVEAFMRLGMPKTATQELEPVEIEAVVAELRRGGDDGGTGVREPRSPAPGGSPTSSAVQPNKD